MNSLNKPNHKLAIFDWDGTIMDSVARIVESMQGAALRAKLPMPSEQAVKDIIGLSLAPAFEQLFGLLSQEQVDLMVELYREEYLDTKYSDTPVFDDIEQVLETLVQRGYTLAVATGKSRAGLDRLFKASGLGRFFNDSITADEANSKPDAQMIERLMTRLGVEQDVTVMIGDSILDMTMANNAGVKGIGVSYGAHTVEVLAQAKPAAIVAAPIELLNHL